MQWAVARHIDILLKMQFAPSVKYLHIAQDNCSHHPSQQHEAPSVHKHQQTSPMHIASNRLLQSISPAEVAARGGFGFCYQHHAALECSLHFDEQGMVGNVGRQPVTCYQCVTNKRGICVCTSL
eukprot:TRINITY_DN67797_c1_g2_i18.p3 TRINITY_DN67797_c1_g2~~TRINITY_DN67797_c1_g2_i18.p3  ORF type:complete len:124 (-),score=15.80 TRINITY_DN67797_c1_g2_i18:305-676(-)